MKIIGKSVLVFLCVVSFFIFNINNPFDALAQKAANRAHRRCCASATRTIQRGLR